MGDWLTRAWLQEAGDDKPEAAAKVARTQYVNSVHDS